MLSLKHKLASIFTQKKQNINYEKNEQLGCNITMFSRSKHLIKLM